MSDSSDICMVLGVPINNLSLSGAIAGAKQAIEADEKMLISVLDAAMIMNMRMNPESDVAIRASDVILADGYYVVLASRILGTALAEQVTGFDLTEGLLRIASESGLKIYFLGAQEAVLQSLLESVRSRFGGEIIAGSRNGYFSSSDEAGIVEEINQSGADILLVGISSPLREMFLSRNRNRLMPAVLLGVGGVFDILGGKTTRAPVWIQRARIEWFYRFLLEPIRMWRRVFNLYPRFALLVLGQALFRRS